MINKKYLPSKKFVIALSVSIGLILLVIFLNYLQPNIQKYKINKESGLYASSSLLTNTDTDKDGIPDWLENLYGTDPKNPDTDGDGTSDHEEVLVNRYPLVPNTAPKGQEPNDKIEEELIEKNKKITEEYENLNSTEKMARNLLSNILASQSLSGETFDEYTLNLLSQKIINDVPDLEYKEITRESDLNIIKLDEKTFDKNLTTYKLAYVVQTENLRKIVGEDIVIINKYLSSNDLEKKIKVITDQYQKIINALIKIPIPANPNSAGVLMHLKLINGIEKLIQIDNDIIRSFSIDTARVFSNISLYNNTIKDLGSTILTIDNFLQVKR